MKRFVVCGLLVSLISIAASLTFLRCMIVSGLDRAIERAQQAYPYANDDVAALMEYAAADAHTLRDRNAAIWALGQLRDDRALPILEQFLTGGECDHERALCQREVRKAIDMCMKDIPDLLLVSNR